MNNRDAQNGNRDRLRTYWPELRGRVQEQWSRLDNEGLDDIDGRHDRLAEKLRDAYGVSEAEANRQVDDFVETHWNALSANRMSSTDARGGRATATDTHGPGPTDIGRRKDDPIVGGTGSTSPGGRKI